MPFFSLVLVTNDLIFFLEKPFACINVRFLKEDLKRFFDNPLDFLAKITSETVNVRKY